jgi:hypothetical protein
VFVYELYGEWKGNEDISTTILTYWHLTVHRLKALFSQKIPPRFLYSLWRSSVKENYKSIGLPFFFFSLAKLFQYSTA